MEIMHLVKFIRKTKFISKKVISNEDEILLFKYTKHIFMYYICGVNQSSHLTNSGKIMTRV